MAVIFNTAVEKKLMAEIQSSRASTKSCLVHKKACSRFRPRMPALSASWLETALSASWLEIRFFFFDSRIARGIQICRVAIRGFWTAATLDVFFDAGDRFHHLLEELQLRVIF